jgi:hypothetical protein
MPKWLGKFPFETIKVKVAWPGILIVIRLATVSESIA